MRDELTYTNHGRRATVIWVDADHCAMGSLRMY